MKHLIFGVTFMVSLSSFANLTYDEYEAIGESVVIKNRITFECTDKSQDLTNMLAQANDVAEIHGVEGNLPSANSACEHSILRALEYGLTEDEIREAIEKSEIEVEINDEDIIKRYGMTPEEFKRKLQEKLRKEKY